MILQYVTLMLTTLHVCTKAQFHPMGLSPAMSMGMGMPNMPVHMPIVGPPQMPVVVMPYHSRTVDKFREKPRKSKKTKRPKKKRRQRLESDSNSDSDSDSSSSSGSSSSSDEKKFRTTKDHFKNLKRRRQVLTPVVSYVTKDGYVVYQKKIKKDRAKDWLELGKNSNVDGAEDKESGGDEFEARTDKVRKKHNSKSHKSHN